MKKLLVIFVILAVVCSCATQNNPAQRGVAVQSDDSFYYAQDDSVPLKYALVIGNGNYANVTKLANPVNDANAMATVLQDLGFTVEKVLNGTLDQMDNGVAKLRRQLSDSPNSYGFFFYAGHGVQASGENYLLPVDINVQSENQLRQRALSVQAMLDDLNDAGNVLNMIVLDACRDNPFSWARGGSRGLTVVNVPQGSIIMYATSANSTAADGTGENGLFTTELLKNLQIPGLSVFTVFEKTGADVLNASEGKQHPELSVMFFGASSTYLGSRPTGSEQQTVVYVSRETPVRAVQQSPVAVNTSRIKPAWVDNVDSAYTRSQYVAAVGQGADRATAERNATANLAALFGQSIGGNQTGAYYEAVKSGVIFTWAENSTAQDIADIEASKNTLVGAEIREVWYDSRNTYYAAAVAEKTRTGQIYNSMISINQSMITNLIAMSPAEKNTLEGFSRYQFAAAVADINITYGSVLQVLGVAPRQNLTRGDIYRTEARGIAGSIPVGISVKNDRSGRIQGAFAKIFSDLGFRTSGNAARYMLAVDITVSPVDFPDNTNKFVRMEMAARFTDNGATLLPYNFANREGHITMSEAENRVYAAAERKINEEYSKLLSDYFSRLLPGRR